MKTIIASLLILSSLSALSSEKITPVKVFDGTNATCKSSQDHYTYKLQAHLVQSVETTISNETLNLDIKTVMLSCDKNDNGYAFSEKNIFTDFTYNAFKGVTSDNQPIFEAIKVSTNFADLVIFKDGNYTKIASIKATNTDSVTTNFSETVALEDVLSTEELLKYNEGETISKSLDFFLLRNINVEGSQISERFSQSYGAFRLKLKLAK
ncbi:hypothetical protein [Halobacteriovorax sp. JY17]|uniref:hypothetical protein n=1 Tax=Halobacteriovorax sp. JY17 TaxID=2014617 RepID=UPI000C4F9CEB|nr:hypothetical protein [Halobacteriovorax sp. JY17]PIK14214.1 MAG: hypothetical protein CES88_14650 [Halobacteriovorax sp. JY17]